jgi:methyl-accepting chemotaxis protein
MGEKSQSILTNTTDMSRENNNLPSYRDFIENPDDLPSLGDFKEENLPSVDDFYQKPVEEETQTIENSDGKSFVELTDVVQVPEWSELVRLVNDVRKDIPKIPEIKYYDEQLEEICAQIEQIQGNYAKTDKIDVLSVQNEEFEGKLSEIESKIPTVKYYDHDINSIYDKITDIKEELKCLPEVKYYEEDLESLKSRIEQVSESIPTVPDWFSESEETPDFSWIAKSFSLIDDDIDKVECHINIIKEKIKFEVRELNEIVEKKDFELKVDLKNLYEHLTEDFNKTNKNLKETKDKLLEEVKGVSRRIWEQHHTSKDDDRKLKKSLISEQNKLKQSLQDEIKKINEQSVRADDSIVKFITDLKETIDTLPEVKYYDDDISNLRKEFNEEIKTTKGDIQTLVGELHKIASVIKKQQKTITEGYLLNEPPEQKQTAGGQTDPLTPEDQQFATLKDLSTHYRLFINRIQTQMSTMGGGGAGFIKDLDDVEFDQTSGDGKLLIYDQTNSKWVGIASTALGSAGVASTDFISGIAITMTTGNFTNVNVAGTITYDDVTRLDSLGLSTFRSGLEVNTGTATTALLVRGDARITGILTIGTASVTIDGDNNTITAGIVTITNSDIFIGDNVTINSGASGINSAPNVFYVAKDGNDTNNGTSIDNAKLTIASAVGIAQSGSVIKVLSGNYVESNPIVVPAFVAVVGDDLRSCKVLPSNATQDLFHVNKGCKLANMTFSGHTAPAAAVAFPTSGATNVGGGKWKGPYIQNCTSDTTTGTGIRVDGDKAVKTKSMNVDAFTQYNQGGVGVAVTNEGYAQLVSVFTICCDKAITVHKGGQADVANSNCSFGTFGLVANGKGSEQFIGTVTTSAAASQDNVTINVGTGQTRPYDGQIVYFDQLYKSVETITVTNGGSGYTSTPTITIAAPTGPSGETSTAFATLEGGAVVSISIISSGSQYESTPSVTISGGGGSNAAATANMTDTYYTINSATPIVSGITTLTLDENLINTVGVGSTVFFFQQSKIIASSHTFEYIGSGNDITTATPKRGGVTIQANEVLTENGGRVIYTSTDQAGNFRIGDDLQINQNTGTISGRAFSKSLFSEVTPFILALS